MSTNKKLGKIRRVMVGLGGYQGAMLGVGFELGGEHWGVHTGWTGSWCPGIVDPSAMRLIGETLRKANKNDVSELAGVPVEVEFDGQVLVSWRVLKEVL